MKKLMLTMLAVFTVFSFIDAQQVGTPNGNTAFFNTNAQGKLLGHRQAGTFGNFGSNDEWVGIGKPIPNAYGLRVQSSSNAGIFAVTNPGNSKEKLEINWGGLNSDKSYGQTGNFEINQITSFTNPNGKINRFTIKTNGQVGIGTNNPSRKLQVNVAGRDGLRLQGNNGGDVIFEISNGGGIHYIFDDDSNGHALDVESANDLAFNTNGPHEKMRIKENGNVGIGTTAPTNKLHVAATGRINNTWIGGNPNGGGYSDGVSGLYSLHLNASKKDNVGGNIVFLSAGSQKMLMDRYGRLGIKRNPSYVLDVNGSARVTTMFVSSDERFKKDIKGIDNPLDKINALNGFTYRFNDRKIGEYDFSKTTQEKQLGFMAQDVQKVFPELVSADEDGYLSVNYIGLIPVLVEALKAQQEVAKEQKEEIENLQTRMAKLEALLNSSETIQGNLSTPTESVNEGIVLRQNAPNPFNGSTTIEYQLPERLASATLVVSDLNGRTISTYTISGKGNIQFDAGGLDNGIYTYAIIANGQSIATQKMVIQK